MKRLIVLTILLLVSIIGIYAVMNVNKKPELETEKIVVVTTLFPLYDFAKNIGKDKVELTLLLTPGMEAHSFEPKPSDILKINEADIFIYTGEFMEPWAKDVISGISNKNVLVVNASDGIKLTKENGNDEIDPHIWLDFSVDKIIIDAMAKALVEADGENSVFYKANAEEYNAQLMELDQQYNNDLAECSTKRIIYTGHYAFGYLADRYGLSYKSLYGISPDSEISVQDLTGMINQVKSENIEYIFYEKLSNMQVAETIADETGVELLQLNPAHNISKDDFTNAVKFISIMEENLVNLKIGLKCNR